MKSVNFYSSGMQNALGDFNRFFESFFEEPLLGAAKIFNQMPALDILETDDSFIMNMDLPGYDENSIEVHMDGTNLIIGYRHPEERKNEESRNTYIHRERKITSFTRSFKLPDNTDAETVNASFKNGVLTLSIKKRSEAQKRIIQINNE